MNLQAQIRKLRGDLRAWIERERREQKQAIRQKRKETDREIERLRERFGEADELSDPGEDFIINFEGVRLSPYNDPVGHCTVGAGHLIHRGNCTAADHQRYKGMTREDAEDLLAKDMRVFVAGVLAAVTVELARHELDALASFAMNNGLQAFRDSTLLKLLNEGKRGAVPAQMARWVYADGRKLPGLVRRRHSEGDLFARGDYTPRPA